MAPKDKDTLLSFKPSLCPSSLATINIPTTYSRTPWGRPRLSVLSKCGETEGPFGEGSLGFFRPRGDPSYTCWEPKNCVTPYSHLDSRSKAVPGPGTRVSNWKKQTPYHRVSVPAMQGSRQGSECLSTLPWAGRVGASMPTLQADLAVCACACVRAYSVPYSQTAGWGRRHGDAAPQEC